MNDLFGESNVSNALASVVLGSLYLSGEARKLESEYKLNRRVEQSVIDSITAQCDRIKHLLFLIAEDVAGRDRK